MRAARLPGGRYSAGSARLTLGLAATALLTLAAAALAGEPPPPGFAVEVAPARVVVLQGDEVTVEVSVVPEEGFEGEVALSVGGLPFGVSGAVDGGTLTLTLDRHAHVGDHTVPVTGVSEDLRETGYLAVRVLQSQPFAAAFAHTLAVKDVEGILCVHAEADIGADEAARVIPR